MSNEVVTYIVSAIGVLTIGVLGKGVWSFISQNASKKDIQNKFLLQEKDIERLQDKQEDADCRDRKTQERISNMKKEMEIKYVRREKFDDTIDHINEKLDIIINTLKK